VWSKSTDYLPSNEKVWIKMTDMVNHPPHYISHPSGIETIQITEHMNFCLGNAIKYILRADLKGNKLQDLEKASWYINREIERVKNGTP
jgi:hypothetical protein